MTEPDGTRRQVRAAFGRAAQTYDGAAAVQREICAELLALARSQPPVCRDRFVDLGCGTGRGSLPTLDWLQPSEAIAVDFAHAMLGQCDPVRWPRRICADLQALPLPGASIDCAWSSLAMQWCDPGLSLTELARILRPGATAWVATLGPQTLHELRDAFVGIDTARHVIGFHDASQWAGRAQSAGLEVLHVQSRATAATAPQLRALLKDIKAIGAHEVGQGRRRAPLGKSAWRMLEARYETHRRDDGLLPATYDVILLALRKPT
jgi:malonyl-CoA O-methyltransferase